MKRRIVLILLQMFLVGRDNKLKGGIWGKPPGCGGGG